MKIMMWTKKLNFCKKTFCNTEGCSIPEMEPELLVPKRLICIVYFVSFTESPYIQSILPGYQLVNETDSFEVFCNATGNPPPVVTWTQIDDNKKVYATGKSLRVQKAEKSDFGTYLCTAVSVRGENMSALAIVEMDNCKQTFQVVMCLCKTTKNILIVIVIRFCLQTLRESVKIISIP